MTITEIIRQVRWCVDEEGENGADFSDSPSVDGKDDMYTDSIIKSKINDALRWVCMYAPSILIVGDSEEESYAKTINTSDGANKYNVVDGVGRCILPSNTFRIIRARVDTWKRSVSKTIDEDSDDYLELSNDTAMATVENPKVAIIEKIPKEIECYPAGSSLELTVVCIPLDLITPETDNSTNVPLPLKVRTAFLYYIAYLLLTAFDDASAERMYKIAKENLGVSQ
nr:hypothetical protein [Prevotella sp.]